jgi:hypothetical protein
VDQQTNLPTGTVTFMFTEFEGSTSLVTEYGDRAAQLFSAHADIIRAALNQHRGPEVGTKGDSFFCVFASATDAIAAAVAAQCELNDYPWPTDLGLFRPKDVAQPEHLFDLVVDGRSRRIRPRSGAKLLLFPVHRCLNGRDRREPFGHKRLRFG